MSERDHHILRIAVLLDTDLEFGMRILRGVQTYARRQAEWQLLTLHYTQESVFNALLHQGRLSGVLGPVLSDRWQAGLPGAPVPMVNISDHSEIHSVPSVITDNLQAGRLAARHLLQQGYRNFGILHEKASSGAVRRAEGFLQTLAAAGHAARRPPETDSYAPGTAWPEWLRQLPRPCGLFCTSDYLARRILSRLAALGAAVPDDFGVVGVGDSPLDNLLSETPLTSIQLDGQRIGERAARQLAVLLANPGQKPAVELIAPSKLVPRASSARQTSGDPLIARAIARQSLAQPLTGDRLAALCGASRRTLELRFRQTMGCGPATALRRRRLEHAALLLRETPLKLASIAEATGYASSAAFSAAFRKAYGQPPGAWRRQAQTISMQSP
ncbi:MAG: substrate-binding domain-containing protein [Lentisphaerae bacterium]|nr:substrate-binding domain-containing protein [Lentisphaerota bacterium]